MTEREYWRLTTADYLERNRDRVNARRRERYARNREAVLALQAKYRAANRERINARNRERYAEQRG